MSSIFQTDWLASKPVFYNEKTGKVSNSINEVIDFNNIEFDPEGFNNYLDFGYSVFEQTPLKHVKFLPHSSSLTPDFNGNIKIEHLVDPAEEWLGREVKEKDVLDNIEEAIQSWEKRINGEIIIPTSGGFDSRLLNMFIKDKSRIRSFTYGISKPQSESFEVVYAKRLSEILGTKWEQVEIGSFHEYFDDWNQLYGPSTHSHGMYHIEFYKKIRKKIMGNNPLLSGIIGDVWAGGKKIKPINRIAELSELGLTHGMHADSQYSLLHSNYEMRKTYFERVKNKIKDPFWQTLESMRLKIILLSYLLRIPEYIGFNPWTPFLDINIALSMLSISPERRNNRIWQVEYFKKYNMHLENMNLKVNLENSLLVDATHICPLAPLDVGLLRELISPSYVEWINNTVGAMPIPNRLIKNLLGVRKVGGLLRRMGFSQQDKSRQAYCAYLTLKPIDYLLRRRKR